VRISQNAGKKRVIVIAIVSVISALKSPFSTEFYAMPRITVFENRLTSVQQFLKCLLVKHGAPLGHE
jgi:hypothetical protein